MQKNESCRPARARMPTLPGHRCSSVAGSMLKKIAISQLQTGMFVDKVDAPWFQHSLWKTRFLIKDRETLTRVRTCGAKDCWIDTSHGKDVGAPVALTPSTTRVEASPGAKPVVRRSMGDELITASDIIKRSKA